MSLKEQKISHADLTIQNDFSLKLLPGLQRLKNHGDPELPVLPSHAEGQGHDQGQTPMKGTPAHSKQKIQSKDLSLDHRTTNCH